MIENQIDWQPTATLETLKLRARMLERIRAFFARRGILEVETPILSRASATDPHLVSLETHYTGPGAPADGTLYLHTSPEFTMKRLLAAGSGSIYQICHVFRDGESGRLHNPEFTMLEWYRVDFDHHALMDETAELVTAVLRKIRTLHTPEKLSYAEAFERSCGINPHTADAETLAEAARRHGIRIAPGLTPANRDVWCDLLLTHLIQPRLGRGRLTFLYDYPVSQAALARIRDADPPVAERFEVYLQGVELANGFHELGDAHEQRRRFVQELALRQQAGLPTVPMDERFLQALDQGLPDCAGVALGVDRLVMLAAGTGSIHKVIAFPLERA